MTVVGMEVGSPTPSPSPSTVSEFLKANPELGRTLLDTSRDIPDTVIYLVTAIAVLAMAWFLLKFLARTRDWTWSSVSYRRLDPWAQTMRAWFRAAPVTFIYVATWTVTTIIFQGTPETVANVLNRFNSTNLAGIAGSPVRVLFASAFIVAEYGMGFSVYVVVYLLITARLEQRIGSARVIVVGVASHGLGSLLTVAVESVLLHYELLPKSTVLTQDVGVSYVMAGTAAGYLFFVGRRWRWWFAAALFVALVVPLVVSHTIWDLGHFLAATVGLVTTWIVKRWGVRPRMTWRGTAAGLRPRALPTWNTSTAQIHASAVM